MENSEFDQYLKWAWLTLVIYLVWLIARETVKAVWKFLNAVWKD